MELKLDAVLVGRILGGAVILIALLAAIVSSASSRSDQFAIFLNVLATPLGVGSLIIVVTEIWRERSGRPENREPPEAGE